MFVGRARHHQRPDVDGPGSRWMDGGRVARAARARSDERRLGDADESCAQRLPACRTTCVRADTYHSAVPPGLAVIAFPSDAFRTEQLAATFTAPEPAVVVPMMMYLPPLFRLFVVCITYCFRVFAFVLVLVM